MDTQNFCKGIQLNYQIQDSACVGKQLFVIYKETLFLDVFNLATGELAATFDMAAQFQKVLGDSVSLQNLSYIQIPQLKWLTR